MVKKGEKFEADTPEKENYIFKGWYDEPSDGTAWDLESDTVTSYVTLYAQWSSTNTGVRAVSVDGTAGTINGTTIDVVLPAGKELTADRSKISITTADGNASVSAPVTDDSGKTWTFTVTAEDGMTTEDYTINVSVTLTPHSHEWAKVWSNDSGYHWHECLADGCGITADSDKDGYAAHSPGEWITDRAATAIAAGSRHRECTVCGYIVQTESIPATENEPGGNEPGGNEEDSRPDRKPNTGSGSSSSSKPTSPSSANPLPPTVEQPREGGGTPEVYPSDPRPGDSVTVTPKPDNGYQVGKITVTDQNGNPVEVIQNPDGTFRFTQPEGTVTIEMTYVPLSGFQIGEWVNPFTDVFESDWFYNAVGYVVQNGLFSGTSATTFSPNMPMTRGMLVSVLYRAAGNPEIENEIWGYPYADVEATAYYGTAVYWARLKNIASGYSDERFGPDDPITREQLIVMLWRYAGSPAPVSRTLTAPDAGQVGDYALDAVCWAIENGILNGDSFGKLNPQAQATRAEVAQSLKRFFQDTAAGS